MLYTHVIKTAGGVASAPSKESPSELVTLLRQLAAKNDTPMPKVVAESIRTDYDVRLILEYAMEFQKKYFPKTPLAKDLVKQFIYNVPDNVMAGIRYAQNHPELADILNPVIFLYPLLMVNPSDSNGVFLMQLKELFDGSREAIEKDVTDFINFQNESNDDIVPDITEPAAEEDVDEYDEPAEELTDYEPDGDPDDESDELEDMIYGE